MRNRTRYMGLFVIKFSLWVFLLIPRQSYAADNSSQIQLKMASNKCLDVRQSQTANGTPVQIYTCNGTQAQNWSYINGTLRAFGKCLDVTAGNTQNGTKLQLWDCYENNTNQQWSLSENTVVWSNHNKCLDLTDGIQTDSTQMQVWDCGAGNTHQQWSYAFTTTTTPVTSRPTPTTSVAPDFGPNVKIFSPDMSMASIQSTVDGIYQTQETNQFGTDRYAYLFKPGQYNLNVPVGFYTTVLGLGNLPDDVSITGGVTSLAAWFKGNATQNFWRGAENFSVTPTNANINVWAVSQATQMRRVHVKGELWFFDYNYYEGGVNWSSGGFIADSKIDTQVIPGSQQQFMTRNSTLTKWIGGVWNMVFVGSEQTPSGTWADSPFTVVEQTPRIREKPYLVIDNSNNYSVVLPALKTNSQGTSWANASASATTIPINRFYIAHADVDTAGTLNTALQAGFHLLLTPGVYHLSSSLKVNYPDTIIMGIGYATLIPDAGTETITIADVDGVTISGLLLDAGAQQSPTMLLAGISTSSVRHAESPLAIFDVSCRVGGASAGSTESCFTINMHDALIDNVWLWRGDHGEGIGWDTNPADNGLIVNGDDLTAYGLFVEHFQKYQTVWNGNGGEVYFYQSEIPYDVPDQNSWTHDNVKGWASYKVADNVTSHTAQGMGIYCFFYNPVQLENAIETPVTAGVTLNHLITQWFGRAEGSGINHIINGTGAAVYDANSNVQARSSN